MRLTVILIGILCSPAALPAQDDLKAALAKKLSLEEAGYFQAMPLSEALKFFAHTTKIDLVIDPRFKTDQGRNVLDEKVPIAGFHLKAVSAGTAFELVARTLDARTVVRQGKLVLEPAVKIDDNGAAERLPNPKPTAEETAARKKMRERVEAAKVIYNPTIELPFSELLGQVAKCTKPTIPIVVDVQAFKSRGAGNRVKGELMNHRVKLPKPDGAAAATVLKNLAAQVGGELEYLADVVIVVPTTKR